MARWKRQPRPSPSGQGHAESAQLAAFSTMVREHVRQMALEFTEPDDGWPLVGGFVTPVGEKVQLLLDLTEASESAVVADGLCAALAQVGAVRYCVALPCFIVNSDPQEEVLYVEAADAGGASQTWTAAIIRDGVNPPRLGPWRETGPVVDGGLLGLRNVLGCQARAGRRH